MPVVAIDSALPFSGFRERKRVSVSAMSDAHGPASKHEQHRGLPCAGERDAQALHHAARCSRETIPRSFYGSPPG